MNCPMDGTLRAHVDQELNDTETESLDEHLGSCAGCRARLAAIRNQADDVHKSLGALKEEGDRISVDPNLAYDRFRQQFSRSLEAKRSWMHRLLGKRTRSVWGGLAAASAIALLIAFTPTGTWAQKILQMLRIQKVAVVPVDLAVIEDANNNHSAGKMLAQMISDDVVVTIKPSEPQPVANADAASQMAGFHVRTLSELGPPQTVLVQGEAAFHMTLDRDRMQDVLDQVGRSDIQIPASVDRSTVAVHIPKVVRVVYGNCQNDAKDTCISLFQVPSPMVSVPPTLNIPALAEAGLQVAGMNAAEAHAFCQTVDWSSTLVVPFPRNGSSSRTVLVDGVNGTLIETAPHGRFRGEYALLWIKNGIVYSVNGIGSPERALAAVESLN